MATPERTPALILEELLGDGPISPADVFAMSDLPVELQNRLAAAWPQLADERRHTIARHMADLTEENFEVQFDESFRFMLDDPSPGVRLAALDGLWDSDNVSLVTPILNMVGQDESTEVRALAAATLGHYVLNANWGMLPPAVSPRIVASLLAHWDDPETAEPVRRAILETISNSSHGRLPSLIEASYAGGDEAMQTSAIYAMGASADERWLSILIDEMENPREEIRIEAARSAGRIGSAEAVPMLADLTADEDLEVRLAAIYALGQIGGDVALEVVSMLANEDEEDEVAAAVDDALAEMTMVDNLDFSLLDFEPDPGLDDDIVA